MAHEILLNSGDSIDEADLQTAFAAMGQGYIEQDALDVQYFDSDDTIDTTPALARVPNNNRDIPLFVDAITGYSLAANAVNNVWLVVDPSAATDDEAVGLQHNTTGVEPSTPSLLIAEVDTNQSGSDAVTLRNRGTAPSLDGADVNMRSIGRDQPLLDLATESLDATTAAVGTLTGTTAAEDLDIESASAETLSGVTYLLDEFDESTVRSLIESGSAGDAFVVEPGASWTLSQTLSIPQGVFINGNTPRSTGAVTFKKGFDGPLVEFGSFNVLRNIAFHGNRSGYDGHVAVASGRDCLIEFCQFSRGAGDGLHGDPGFYFWEFDSCRFQRNGGWGIYLGSAENPHNYWLGPSYIGKNDAGGVYSFSNGRNQHWMIWCGDNGGPGFKYSGQGFNGLTMRGQIIGNDGPGIHVTGGNHSAHAYQGMVFAENAANPGSGLTTPVGHVHVDGGRFNVLFNAVQSYGTGQFIHSTGAANNHTIGIHSPDNTGPIGGDITGPDHLRLFLATMGTVDGNIDVSAGLGIQTSGVSSASGAIVDPSTGTEIYQRA